MDSEERETVIQPRQSHEEVDLAYDLIQQFAQMLRTRTGEPGSHAKREKQRIWTATNGKQEAEKKPGDPV